MSQIRYWLKTGKVAPGKIVTLWKFKKWRLAEAKKLSLDLSNRRSDALRGDPSASPQDTSLSGRNCGAAFGRPFGFSRQELAKPMVKKMNRLLGVGPSQWPLCRDGDCIEYVLTDTIAFSDLAVYRAHGRWVCHRVIATRRCEGARSYLLKGDAKPYVDGWIPSFEVVGRVCRVNGKSVDTFLGKLLSRGLATLNYAHFILFPHVFRSRFGKHCGRIRSFVTSYPVFERLSPFCFRPWLFFHLESRQIIVRVLRDGFKCSVLYRLYQSLRGIIGWRLVKEH